MTDEERDVDVVVVGAGMAGLTAATQALADGVDVLVLEKGDRPGGSMYVSGGAVWTFTSYEEARETVPKGNASLQRLVVESVPDDLRWLEEAVGADLEHYENDHGEGKRFSPPEFTDQMVGTIRDWGGEIRLRTPMTDLDGDGSSAVTGVRARGPDGRRLAVSADAVIVATGGFQGNERLLKQYVTDHPEDLRLRANPWSTGDGLLAARDLGAKSTTGLGTFYGHNVAAVPAEFEETEFIDATQYYGPKAVALDKRGRRFTDESESDIEETLAQDTAELVGGRAYLVLDHDLYATRAAGRRIGDMVDRAAAFGGRVAEAETLDGLGTALAEWGVQGTRAVETIREFNDSLHGGRPGTLDPPRSDHRNPVDSPPFRAVEVQAGITMTMGGLDVTERMEVLRRTESGTTIEHPRTEAVRTDARRIAGLYGAGADVGNVSHRRYLGGMAQALVTGRIAAANAVDRVT